MDLILHHFFEILFVFFVVFLVFVVAKTMKRNSKLYKKYDESLEFSKQNMERQLQAIKIMEETNSLLTQILAAVKKK